MFELRTALIALAILLAASSLGRHLQTRLPTHLRDSATNDSIRSVMTMLVAFSGLVLGLLVSSAKTDFDAQTTRVQTYGAILIALDTRLRSYGPDAEPVRPLLRAFAATIVSDGWPNEPKPTGFYVQNVHPRTPGSNESVEITNLVTAIESLIFRLSPPDLFHTNVARALRADVLSLQQNRWRIVLGDEPTVSTPFIAVLIFWLAIIFVSFGLFSPRNRLVISVATLSSISVASVLWIILELDTRSSGIIFVSSQPLRDALVHMDLPSPDPTTPLFLK